MTPPAPARKQTRILLRNGRYNIAKKGVRRAYLRDFYHQLLTAPWPGLIAIMVGSYVAVNALFAGFYLLIGDAIENARPGSFADAFFFSVQTMATIGYGKMVPHGTLANVLVTTEALLGLAGLAVATGLLFAKFSRPTARVMFSKNAIVTTRNGVETLVFRVANERDSLIVEASMRVVVTRTETTAEGETMRRFHDLTLARSSTAIFPLSWTIMHTLDDKSPLKGMTKESLAADETELIASLVGIEETLADTVHARYSYTAADIHFGARFVDIVTHEPDGRRVVDYTRFHDVETQ